MGKITQLIILLMLLIAYTSTGQIPADSTKMDKKLFVILLINGEQIVGQIVSDDGREILVISEKIGKIYLAKSQIKEIKEFEETPEKIANGDYLLESPFTTRYSFTTNALPIKKNVNYTMINLYGPELHFAVTKRLSLGIMTTWLGSPLAIVGKYTMRTKNEKLNFAIGSIIGSSGYLLNGRGYGSLNWVTGTYGNRIDNISLSGGYGFINNFIYNDKFKGGPIFSIAGIKRIGKTTSFFFDSMLSYTKFNRTETVFDIVGHDNFGYPIYGTAKEITHKVNNVAFFFMPGMRFQKVENKAFQISLAGLINIQNGETNSFPFPMLSWFYKL